MRRRFPITRNLGVIIPEKAVSTLKYSDFYTASGVAPSFGWNWKANSIYDPDQTGAGHQPMGSSQLAAWYNQYSVLSSTIRVAVSNQQGLVNVYSILFQISDLTAIPASVTQASEQAPNKRIMVVSPQSPVAFRDRWSCKLLADKTVNTGTTGGLVAGGTDPSNVEYFRFFAQTANASNLGTAFSFSVEIFYKVLFTDKKNVAPS